MILINFSFALVFVKKIKLNFRYKKMTEKLYDNLQEKYKIHISDYKNMQIKNFWAFSNFSFNSTVRKKYAGLRNCLEIRS